MNAFAKLISMMALGILASCASIPSDYPKPPSFALEDTRNTELGRRVSELTRTHVADESGFYVLTEGVDALATRLILADRAERSIDSQYFIVEGDLAWTLLGYLAGCFVLQLVVEETADAPRRSLAVTAHCSRF